MFVWQHPLTSKLKLYNSCGLILLVKLYVLDQWKHLSIFKFTFYPVSQCMLLKVLVDKVPGNGFYGGWNYDNKHRQEDEVMGIFESIWPCNNEPLPWRITGVQRKILDKRMGKLIWPQHNEKLYYSGDSFWSKSDRIWKTRCKIRLLYFIISTQLRYQVHNQLTVRSEIDPNIEDDILYYSPGRIDLFDIYDPSESGRILLLVSSICTSIFVHVRFNLSDQTWPIVYDQTNFEESHIWTGIMSGLWYVLLMVHTSLSVGRKYVLWV